MDCLDVRRQLQAAAADCDENGIEVGLLQVPFAAERALTGNGLQRGEGMDLERAGLGDEAVAGRLRIVILRAADRDIGAEAPDRVYLGRR